MTQIITSLTDVSSRYKALFVDLWGCVHNGITAYPEAVAALQSCLCIFAYDLSSILGGR